MFSLGWSIKAFADGDPIPLYHNKIFSDSSSLQYAYSTLPFVCPPTRTRHPGAGLVSGSSITLNLGEVLRGDRITISDYDLRMGEDKEFEQLCIHTVSRRDVYWAQDLVRDNYMVDWIVDNLPAATSFVTTDKSRKYYAAGFRLGYTEYGEYDMQPRYIINNHVTLVIRTKQAPGRAGRNGKKVILGFEVYPKSIEAGHRNETGYPLDLDDISGDMELALSYNQTYTASGVQETENDSLDIPFSYSVYFRDEEDETLNWGNRWDMYFVPDDDSRSVHWLAIINSLVIFGFLTALVAVIFTRTIRGDIKGYMEPGLEDGKLRIKRPSRKSLDKAATAGLLDPVDSEDLDSSEDDDLEDTTGWKLVHGDVFRTPTYGPLLAPLIGSGIQLVLMAGGILLLSCVGVLNPSFRGGYVSVGITLFVIAGLFSGYFSARVYRTFGGHLWQQNCVVTGSLVPGLLFAILFVLNLFVWAQSSSNAIPFGTLVALLVLWLLVQLPLVYVGAWVGHHRHGAWDHPVRPTIIARQIPPQPWYLRRPQVVILGGLVPFLIILIELMYVFKSLWLDKSGFYYMFGFLAFVGLVLLVAVCEVTVVVVYLQLCAEVSYLFIVSISMRKSTMR
jgi:transmembrane 9 superfamily member 2/4